MVEGGAGALVVTGPHGRGTALRALASVLGAAGLDRALRGQPGPAQAGLVLDLAADVVRVDGRAVRFVLGTPRPGEVGIVEDLLVDRAFADVAGEATALATLGEVAVASLDELRWVLGAATLARAAGAGAEAVAAGLRQCPPDPHRHLHVVDGVAWVEDPSADPLGPLAYDRVVWVVGSEVDVQPAEPRLRAVVRRHAPEVPVQAASSSDTPAMHPDRTPDRTLDRARAAARPGDTVLLGVPGLAGGLA